MAISGQQKINVSSAPNQQIGSDSLFVAFNKIENNFNTLFSSASTYVKFVGDTGISTATNDQTGTVTVKNTGVVKLLPGTGISLSGSNGDVTISVSGDSTGELVAGVTSVGVTSSSLTVSNSPIVSDGNITINLPVSGVVAGAYTAPTVTVDKYGRITSIVSTVSTGTVTSVAVNPGTGIAVSGSPITSDGTISIVNTGVTKLTAGTGIVLSGSNGDVTISARLATQAGTVTKVGVVSSTLTVTGTPVTSSGNIQVELPNSITLSGGISASQLIVAKANLGPADDVKILGGTSGYILQTDGTGNLSWTAQAGIFGSSVAAAGSNTHIQFNDAGVLGANTNLKFNKDTGVLTAGAFKGDAGNISNIPGANITGNLTNANITANLTVGGNATVTGNLTVNGLAVSATAANGTNSTQLATTAFVTNALTNYSGTATLTTALAGKAPLLSPEFTGTPLAPTASQAAAGSKQIATTEYVKSAISGLTTTSPTVSQTIPTGVIMMWSGATSAIPSGFRICDGTNSTPDLRNKFIIGAGSTYTVGVTGGTADAVVASHTHTASSSFAGDSLSAHTHGVTDPKHNHIMGVGIGPGYDLFGNSGVSTNFKVEMATAISGYGGISTSGVQAYTSNSSTGISITSGSAGTPSGTVSTTVNTAGISGTNQNLPPYYALCFIMKT
jgi:hypothetical protein